MVTPADFEWRRSLKSSGGVSSLGGDIDLSAGGLIDPKAENNLYSTAQRAECIAGSTKYRIIYMRYIGSESPVKGCALAQFFDTSDGRTKVEWAFDPQPHKYIWAPWGAFNGTSDNVNIGDIDVTQFSVSVWFNTSKDYVAGGTVGVIVAKGILGVETAGSNFNYIIAVSSADNKLLAGFEEGSGVDHFVSGVGATVNDGKWHHALVTYDGAIVRLYLDGSEIGTHATATTPESNNQNAKIGSDSSPAAWFEGKIDEVIIWNNDLLASEVTNYYSFVAPFPQVDNIVYFNNFGNYNGTNIAQELTNETTAPAGSPVYQEVSNVKPDPPNYGEISTNEYFPIILKYTLNSNDPTLLPEIENDTAGLRFYFGIQSSQTGGGGTGGGDDPADINNLIIGFNADWGEEDKTDDMVAQLKNFGTDIVISGGDNAYASSTSGFFNAIKPIDHTQGSSTLFLISLGNHDADSSSKQNSLLNHFGLNKGYYSFEVENVHICVLDSENSPTGSAQVNFATEDLTNARLKENIDWIIVVFHRPIYTGNSNHGPDEAGMRTTYMPIFEAAQVDLVLSGHNHNIQRTFPVTNKSANDPRIMDSTQGPYAQWKGIIFVINGTGGHDAGSNLYEISNNPAFNAYQEDSKNMNFYMITSNNGKTLTCGFIDDDDVTRHAWVMTR